jgi:hypothetical protein
MGGAHADPTQPSGRRQPSLGPLRAFLVVLRARPGAVGPGSLLGRSRSSSLAPTRTRGGPRSRRRRERRSSRSGGARGSKSRRDSGGEQYLAVGRKVPQCGTFPWLGRLLYDEAQACASRGRAAGLHELEPEDSRGQRETAAGHSGSGRFMATLPGASTARGSSTLPSPPVGVDPMRTREDALSSTRRVPAPTLSRHETPRTSG